MERQEFLKRAGLGSIVASFPLFANAAWANEDDDDGNGRGGLRYYLVSFSGVGGRALTATTDAIILAGCGAFNGSRVSGGGEYVRTDATKIPNAPVNDTGSWKARRLLSWQPHGGTWGVFTPGIIVMEVKLVSASNGRARGATLEIVCNIGPANLLTGKPEGFSLSGGGLPTFVQLNPTVGLTAITTPVRKKRKDDDDDDD